ncbi:MAG: hypothetical protein ACREOZ_01580 [Gloeomargaritales cyanobacterium]
MRGSHHFLISKHGVKADARSGSHGTAEMCVAPYNDTTSCSSWLRKSKTAAPPLRYRQRWRPKKGCNHYWKTGNVRFCLTGERGMFVWPYWEIGMLTGPRSVRPPYFILLEFNYGDSHIPLGASKRPLVTHVRTLR